MSYSSQQDFLDKIEGLRQEAAKLLGSSLGSDPTLAETLLATLNAQLDAWVGSERKSAPPPDHGLAALIGLGNGAAADIGTTHLAPPVNPYDEGVSSARISAAADLYYVYQHERLGVFRALLKLRELFRAGTVRLSTGKGAFRLYQFDRKQVLRYTHADRWAAYRRVFGYGSAPVPKGGQVNTDFHRLLGGFMQQVAAFWRDKRISETIRPRADDPSYGSIAIVRRAGLDLRNNLKWSSYGDVNVMRVELMDLLSEAFEILGSDDVRDLFGADNVWDVIEEVLTRHAQEKVLISPRQRMAETGRQVLQWLARPHILQSSRTQFETLLAAIAEPAEEWATSVKASGSQPGSSPVLKIRAS